MKWCFMKEGRRKLLSAFFTHIWHFMGDDESIHQGNKLQTNRECKSSLVALYWRGQIYICRAAAIDHFHDWLFSKFIDLCAESKSEAKCNSRTKTHSINYDEGWRKAANLYIWGSGNREYSTEAISWLSNSRQFICFSSLTNHFSFWQMTCFNTAIKLKLWYLRTKLIMCVITTAFPWGTSALYEAASLFEGDRLRSVEKRPCGLGSSPWKSQSNDPLRARYIIQQADWYNPLDQILGRNSDTNETRHLGG